MLEQIASAQADLETNIDELRKAIASGGNGASLGQADAQLHGLSSLQHRITNAHGASLIAIRAEVTASVAATQAFAQQARGVTASAQNNEVSLHAASAAAHREVASFMHDFYEKKIFDPYLRFDTPADEKAYREREESYRRAIEAAQAEGTADGNLRALDLSRAQLLDAGAHGADKSPDYQGQLDRLDRERATLGGAMARSASGPTAASSSATADNSAGPTPTVDPKILASLRAAGITLADQSQQGHGVTEDRSISGAVSRV